MKEEDDRGIVILHIVSNEFVPVQKQTTVTCIQANTADAENNT